MKISGIHHCSIVVQDLDIAAGFYRDVLGLTEIPVPATFGPAGIQARWFAIGTGQLHLILGEESRTDSRRHIALQTGDADEARKRFAALGIETRETTPIPWADRFFIRDPDGNRIEIIEITE
jgi:glyoxylase I family protein